MIVIMKWCNDKLVMINEIMKMKWSNNDNINDND